MGTDKVQIFLVVSVTKQVLLARRGLDHPEKCLLCDQDEETIDYLLISCVFARQFWFNLRQQVHIQQLASQVPLHLWTGGVHMKGLQD
jgi:hypothetical protein